jgi:RimJ/RimL family protein N-acetyltransferase
MKYKLRNWEISDLEKLVEHANNSNIAKWLTNQFPYPYTEIDGRAYIEMVMNDSINKVFAIDISGDAVGSIGIFLQSDVHCKNAEIGYWLSEKYWGKGIMTEAIKEIVEYGFKTFDIVRIYARPFSTNKGSQRVLEKARFRQEARLEKALYKNGEYLDEIIYSKLKELCV